MENFERLPRPFRIRVIEPVKRITRAYREEAIIKSGMNPFLLDSEDVLIDLLINSGTGAVMQSTQAVMMRSDEVYSGNRSYYALVEPVRNIFGYQYTIPTHRGRGAEQICISVLTKKHEQEKGLDRSKMVAFSNYFFDTMQGHGRINGCTVRNVYIKEAFDTGTHYDFKDGPDLGGLERGIEGVSPNNVPYIVITITSNSAGGQLVSLVNLKAMYSIAKKYDIPVVMDSACFTESAYFIKQREAEYEDWAVEQITRETYRHADMLTMSTKEDVMVPTGDLLCMKDDSFFNVYTECRTFCVVQKGFLTYDGLKGSVVERLAAGLYDGTNLDQLAYRIAQVQYLVDGLEEIGVACQQVGGCAAFVNAGKLLPHIPADQFPAQALARELYKVVDIRAVGIGSFLLGHDSKTGKQLPYPVELLCLIIPCATHTQTYMDFIIETFKHVKESATNIKGLAFTYEPGVLHHFIAKPKEA